MGKGGGALSAWLKEFTALVFTQTIQAFIYAMIITIILFGVLPSDGTISSDDNNAALGLMATFALLSVFKVEDMARKIFGIGDSKASHKNAMKSIAKTAIAAKLGSRVLDNVGKVTGGIKAVNKAGQDRRKQKKRLEEDMKDNGYVRNKDGTATYVGKSKGSSSNLNSSTGEGSFADNTASDNSATAGIDAAEKTAAKSTDNAISDAAKRRVKNALRNYEDKLAEIDKARNEGWKSIASGIMEAEGAKIGAVAGGLIGGADGDLDELLQGIMAGAGAGDIVGKNVVAAADRAIKFAERNMKRERGVSSKELKKTIEAYKAEAERQNVYYGSNVDDI